MHDAEPVRHVERLVSEHQSHLRKYLAAPINEKHFHFIQMSQVWRELKANAATSEVHRHSLTYVNALGLVRGVGIPR